MLLRNIWVLLLAVSMCGTMVAREPDFVTKNSHGKEFWLCFMKNFRENAPTDRQNRPEALRLQLFITSGYDATVNIKIEEIEYDNTVTIKANTVVNVQLPARTQLRGTETPERLAIHITADTTIAVYGLNSRFQTTDTYMGLPVSVLGTEYRVVGYTKLSSDLVSSFTVIATEDETELDITPTVATAGGRRPNETYRVKLRKGDAYTVGARWESIGTCDLTGSRIQSNKKIAVFSGHTCAYVPPKVESCNHLVEQLPPVQAWGKHYYLGNLRERSKYTYRVIASEPQTKVFEDSKLIAVLKAGEFYEALNTTRHLQITADKPILVAQFAQGFRNGDSVGDPMMILVSPTQQFLNEYRFATPINGDWHHYINVVSPTTGIGSIRLNGRKVDSTAFVLLGESRYSIAQLAVPFGTHVIKGTEPFGLYSYGFGFKGDAYDAYGNMAGQSFFELSKVNDTLPPLADGKNGRDEYLVTFRDDRTTDKGLKEIKVLNAVSLEAILPKVEEGAPQVAVRIRPTISGQAGRIQFLTTDAAGNTSDFTVCYVYDSRSNHYVFQLNEGKNVQCASETSWFVGGGITFNHTDHEVLFSRTGNLTTPGTFNTHASGFGMAIGGLVGRRIYNDLSFVGKVGLQFVGGTLLAPDSVSSTIFDAGSQKVVPYQEASTIGIGAPLLNFAASAEYFPLKYFYLTGGVQVSVLLGKSSELKRIILRPHTINFAATGSREQDVEPQTLESFSTLNLGLFGGIGFTYPVSFKASVFIETLYTKPLYDVVNDAPWSMQTLGFTAGVRWRI